MAKNIGPRMNDVIAFVMKNPGLAMIHAARLVSPNGSVKFGYRTVHRVIRRGLIITKPGPGGSKLLYPV